ncbi:Cytokine Receptor-Like Factor 1 [Manis pentadactyla]|nr:Cytokine Receptor-Like Factor 1 [Manis pentadactyla]
MGGCRHHTFLLSPPVGDSGLSRFQVDFEETASWYTLTCFLMGHDGQVIPKHLLAAALSTHPTTEKTLSMLASAHPSVDDFANQPKYRIFSRLKINDSLKNNTTVSECTEQTSSEQ